MQRALFWWWKYYDLLRNIQYEGLDNYIKEAVNKGIPYLGVSAGCVIAGMNICSSNDNSKPTATANKAVSHLYFSNPFKKSNLLSTHPNIDERIKRLENM